MPYDLPARPGLLHDRDVVDEFVDPFDLRRVMWALSTKVDRGRDVVRLPSMSVTPADPGSSPQGITDKLLIDATTPVEDLPDVDAWFRRLWRLRAEELRLPRQASADRPGRGGRTAIPGCPAAAPLGVTPDPPSTSR